VLIRAKRGDRVLDLCCGSGDLAFLLSQKVGIDGEVGLEMSDCLQGSEFSRESLYGSASQMWQVMAVDFSRQQLQTAASRRDQRWKSCYKNIK
jgi:demethylmenaquinone methyltransferase/2-methoxy-6-polyprenyl-1,4-benzoquinol methylase